MPLWELCVGRVRADSDTNPRNQQYSLDNIVDILHVGPLRTTINEEYQPFLLRDNGQLSTENGRLWLDMSGAEVVVNAEVYSYRICEPAHARKASMYTTVQAPDRAQFLAWRAAFEVVLRGTRICDAYRVFLNMPLAVGRHSLVFRGKRVTPSVPVAIKVLPRAVPHERRSFALTTVSRAICDNVVKDAHLASVLDVYHTRNETHVVMSLYNATLADVLNQRIRLPEPDARLLFRQLAGALRALHTEGFVHGAVVPSNVLIESDCPLHIRLSGFSLSSVPDPRMRDRENKAPAGRTLDEVLHALKPDGVQYLAPELLNGSRTLDNMSSSSDFWALGVLLYRALTGELPFRLDRVGQEFGGSPPDSVPGVMKSYLEKAITLELLFPESVKKYFTADSISLITLLVSHRNDRRCDFNAISQHPWATEESI